jgi:hypothetical protein
VSYNVISWEEGSTNLLSDTSCFTSLDISLSQFIKNQSLSGIDVTKNANNWTTKLFVFLLLSSSLHCFQTLSISFFTSFLIISGKDINDIFFDFAFLWLICLFLTTGLNLSRIILLLFK